MFQTHFVCSMPQPYNMSFIQGAMVSLLKNDTKTQNLDIVGLLVTIDWFLNVEAIFHFCNKRFLSVRILSYISKSEGLLLFLRTVGWCSWWILSYDFIFLCYLLLNLVSGKCCPHKMSCRYSLLSNHWSLYKIWYFIYIKVLLWKSPEKNLGLGILGGVRF